MKVITIDSLNVKSDVFILVQMYIVWITVDYTYVFVVASKWMWKCSA